MDGKWNNEFRKVNLIKEIKLRRWLKASFYDKNCSLVKVCQFCLHFTNLKCFWWRNLKKTELSFNLAEEFLAVRSPKRSRCARRASSWWGWTGSRRRCSTSLSEAPKLGIVWKPPSSAEAGWWRPLRSAI